MIDFDNGLLPDAFPGTQHSNNLHARSSKPSSRSARDMISVILAGGVATPAHPHEFTHAIIPWLWHTPTFRQTLFAAAPEIERGNPQYLRGIYSCHLIQPHSFSRPLLIHFGEPRGHQLQS
jgi:hypothetical protein